SFYSEREFAALAFNEAVTLVSQTHVPDVVYAQAMQHYTDEELVNLVTVIVTINVWNRYCITFRDVTRTYASLRKPQPAESVPAFDGQGKSEYAQSQTACKSRSCGHRHMRHFGDDWHDPRPGGAGVSGPQTPHQRWFGHSGNRVPH